MELKEATEDPTIVWTIHQQSLLWNTSLHMQNSLNGCVFTLSPLRKGTFPPSKHLLPDRE